MVAYSELREDREQPLQADLAKEVERLRLELALAEGGFAVPQDSQERDQT